MPLARAKPWSIASRLRWKVMGLVGAAWLATIGLSAVTLTHEMNEFFDEELSALVETTVLLLDAREGDAIPRAIGIASADPERVLRILRRGQENTSGPWPPIATDGFHDRDGWRVLRRSIDNLVIEAGHSRDWRREEIGEAGLAFLVLILPLLALLAVLLPRGLHKGLTPLHDLSTDLQSRKPRELHPVDGSALPTELQPLALSLNGYLARIAALNEAERSFISNASHELRTPLAVIRSEVELQGGPVAAAVLPPVDRLIRRVERLLQMSRAESGAVQDGSGADIAQILRILVSDARRTGGDIALDDGDLEQHTIPADPDAVAIVLRNLIENAVEHGSGQVRITLRRDSVCVENPVAADAQLIDAPFAKGANSRGTGLGLAIVGRLTQTMGMHLERKLGRGRVSLRLIFNPDFRP